MCHTHSWPQQMISMSSALYSAIQFPSYNDSLQVGALEEVVNPPIGGSVVQATRMQGVAPSTRGLQYTIRRSGRWLSDRTKWFPGGTLRGPLRRRPLSTLTTVPWPTHFGAHCTLVGGPPPCPWGRERPVAHRQLNLFHRRSRGGVVIEVRMDPPPWLNDSLIGGNGMVSEGRANLEFWFRSAPAISELSYLSGPGTRVPEGSRSLPFPRSPCVCMRKPLFCILDSRWIFVLPIPPPSFPLRPFGCRVFWYFSSVVLFKYKCMSVPRSGYFGPYNWQILLTDIFYSNPGFICI